MSGPLKSNLFFYRVLKLVLVIALFTLPEYRVSAVTCSSGWTKYGENCYRLYTSKLPWMNALKACQAVGSSLVDVGSDGEQTFVHNLARGYEFWISGSDSSTEGQWLWYGSIQSWGYTKWNSGEPNNAGGEDCASLLSSGRWNDYPCSRSMAYICEQTTALDACDSTWSFRNGRCYKLFTSKVTWSNALKTCQANSANLVNVADSGENSFVHGLLRGESVWMGGFDGPTEGSWAWSGGVFTWSYTNWKSGEPNNSGDEDCNMMYSSDGKWNDGKCSGSLQFMCEKNTPPINGGWSGFGSYGSCSRSCGGGTKTRSRTCTNPAPQWGGDNCPGSSTSSQACNTHSCPINGGWSSWGGYGSCTVTCGGGTQQRSRTCTNPAPQYGGANCPSTSTSSQSCNTHNCPIDGQWTSWGSWGSCSVSCGGGSQSRSRSCTNPAPQYGGSACPGSSSASQACNTHNCPINGGWTSWGSYGSCTVTCGGGTQQRSRTCTNPAPQYGGANCPWSSTSSQSCNTHNCPIDGQWTSWGSWGSCSVSCGGGSQSRSRSCTNPAPQYGGSACPGFSSTSQACNTHNCPINGGWSSWGSYGSCTVTCGGGTQQRSRTCTNPAPQYGGANCPSSSTSSQSCNTQNCPIDGRWSSWGSYGTCSVTCGGGTRSRSRTCTSPSPQYGGASCPGANSMSQDCNTQVCIIDGSWGAWATWGACTKTCGGGRRSRSRFCTNPRPANGGLDCPGSSADFDDCNTGTCTSVAAGTYQQLCPTGFFTCQSGGITCIQSSFQCDCSADCDDGSDETTTYAGCTMADTCENGAGRFAISLPILFGTILSGLLAVVLSAR
ncbi:SCO-spondin isoform X1 [Magallana gigas]|uniref:SCO-spondin isoform X1 n=1 Tax=Magallana gigas TaxID=29159 RepID=UPI003342D061